MRRLPATLLPLLLLALSALPAGGCATDRQVIAQAADAHSMIRPAVITQQDLAAYVERVGDRVVAAAREVARDDDRIDPEKSAWMFEDVRFHLVNSDVLNAFTTGGEHVYLYGELLRACEDEDEFAAVVAHEFGHIYGRHVHDKMNAQIGLMATALVAGGGAYALSGDDDRLRNAGIAAGATAGLGQFALLGFSRDEEFEADELGFDFYVRAGYDPAQFPGFFETMIERGYDKGSDLQNLAQTHPRLSKRVERIEAFAADLPPDADRYREPPIADSGEFRRLQRLSAKVGKSMPTDQTLSGAKELLAAFPSCVTPFDNQPEQVAAQRRMAEAMERSQPQ